MLINILKITPSSYIKSRCLIYYRRRLLDSLYSPPSSSKQTTFIRQFVVTDDSPCHDTVYNEMTYSPAIACCPSNIQPTWGHSAGGAGSTITSQYSDARVASASNQKDDVYATRGSAFAAQGRVFAGNAVRYPGQHVCVTSHSHTGTAATLTMTSLTSETTTTPKCLTHCDVNSVECCQYAAVRASCCSARQKFVPTFNLNASRASIASEHATVKDALLSKTYDNYKLDTNSSDVKEIMRGGSGENEAIQ